jgi:hypothetical protein
MSPRTVIVGPLWPQHEPSFLLAAKGLELGTSKEGLEIIFWLRIMDQV